MISKEEVKHIAKLARLDLNTKEIEKMGKELSSILDYIEQLKEVDISGVEPTTHSIPLENVMREDKAEKDFSEKAEKLVEAAPEKEEGWVKVKSILTT